MKRFTFLILFLSLSGLVMAQPVLNQNMNFALGDTYRIDGYYEVAAIDVGNAGPDKNWDFSEIDGDMFIEGEPALVVNSSATPFADSAAVQMSDVAVKLLNSDEGPYLYFKNHNNRRELIAQGYYTVGGSVYGPWDPPMTDLQYPLAIGSGFDFNYEYMSWHIEDQYYNMRDSGHVHVEADAWGSITTPFGEFSNVLRVKSVITSHLWMGFDAEDPLMYLGEFVDIQYNWYDPEIKAPVMSVSEMSFKCSPPDLLGTYTNAFIKTAGISSSTPLQKNREDSFYTVQYLAMYGGQTSVNPVVPILKVGVYPNPAHGIIKLNLPAGHAASEASIFDLTGRQVIRCMVVDDKIDISNLLPGMYILQVITQEGMKAESKMIVK